MTEKLLTNEQEQLFDLNLTDETSLDTLESIEENEDSMNQEEYHPIYRDGLTEDMVIEWKRKYGKVFATNFRDKVFVYKAITRGEFKNEISKIEDWEEREDRIVEMNVLWPTDFDFTSDNAPAGYIALIAESIYEVSGFAPIGPAIEL